MEISIEKISIWILEALESEWRREPDIGKCRPVSEVLGPLKQKHNLTDADITRGVKFCLQKGYIDVVTRHDGQAMLPSDDGLTILGKIAQVRLDEQEKKKWSRSDKISLASLVFAIVAFFLGFFLGDHFSKRPESIPVQLPQTNTTADTSTVLH